LRCEVASVDTAEKQLHLKVGGPLGFDKLVIATGAQPRRLTVPGAELEGV
jgi:3-phenylpropionate/trans-cinnamate dioxygenase ferredoxin reductase component